ncbi:MAG: DNA repair and recombination protein RadA [Candidatus Nitrosopolaris sp.]
MMQPDKDVSTPKSEFTTARQHYFNRRNTIERISTGSRNIDAILCGGVETKAVTEFYGAPSSGKTQLCHTMSALVPQDISGGVCGKSIYMDTEGTFRPERIAEIAEARGFDPNMTTHNVVIEQVADSKRQEQVLDKIESLLKNKCKTKRFKLLVVDSAVTHYRSEYIGRANLPKRQQKLFWFMRRLVAIAHTYNIAVVVTNHINTTTNSRKMRGIPVGGNVMGHAATYSVRLWTLNQFLYHAEIVRSPYHPQNTKSLYIGNKGLLDDNPNAVPRISTWFEHFLDT